MNTLYLVSNNQIFNVVKGVFLLLTLFAACFFLTHFVKYALLGWRSQKPAPPPPEKKEEEKAPTPPPEPVYYIVERKQRRAKAQYSQPKEIRFK